MQPAPPSLYDEMDFIFKTLEDELNITMDLIDDSFGRAAVPSGASTGEHEAVELRDNAQSYFGKSVEQAVENVNHIIANKLVGMDALDIQSIDNKMIKLIMMIKIKLR